jgi:hypothetical protein
VKGINDQIRITPSVGTGEVKEQIEKALVGDPKTDARVHAAFRQENWAVRISPGDVRIVNIRMEGNDGKVSLQGTVIHRRSATSAALGSTRLHPIFGRHVETVNRAGLRGRQRACDAVFARVPRRALAASGNLG